MWAGETEEKIKDPAVLGLALWRRHKFCQQYHKADLLLHNVHFNMTALQVQYGIIGCWLFASVCNFTFCTTTVVKFIAAVMLLGRF